LKIKTDCILKKMTEPATTSSATQETNTDPNESEPLTEEIMLPVSPPPPPPNPIVARLTIQILTVLMVIFATILMFLVWWPSMSTKIGATILAGLIVGMGVACLSLAQPASFARTVDVV
jgi:hypothetical protein